MTDDSQFVSIPTDILVLDLDEFYEFCNALEIETKEKGLVKLGETFLGSQLYFFEQIALGLAAGIHYFVVLKGRQLGISTACLALDLYWHFKYPGTQGTLATDTEDNKEMFRATLSMYMQSLPREWRQPEQQHNRNQLILQNRSRLSYQVAGTRKNVGFGAGKAIMFVHATEVGKWGEGTDLSSFEASFAETNPLRLYIWESTAYGFNKFQEMWETAEQALTQRAIFIGWWRNELYQVPEGGEIYNVYWDGKLNPEEEKWVREVRDLYDFEITAQQIAWYRFTLEEKIKGDIQQMHEKYPPCVTAETRVGTAQGIIRIDQACATISATFGQVVSTHENAATAIYKLTTAKGYTVRGTADHPIFKPDGSLVDLALCEGETIALQPPMTAVKNRITGWNEGPVWSRVEVDERLARFIGIFMGDGSFQVKGNSGKLSVAFDAKDREFIDETKALVADLFGVEMHERGATPGGVELRGASTLLPGLFKRLRLTRTNTGATMRNVHVPDIIWESPLPVIAAFLSGLFETDGFVDRKGANIILSSRYDQFMADVQVLLMAFGITCRRERVRTTATVRGVKHAYESTRLSLRKAETREFARKIGFLSKRKRDRCEYVGRRAGGARALPLVLEDRVVSVVRDGFEPVYNLTVDGAENAFDANGVKTHNTADYAFIMSGSQFFNGERINDAFKRARSQAFTPYKFTFGGAFGDTELVEAKEATCTLKIWEPPVAYAAYTIGADPAWGSSEWADRFAINVSRCWADQHEQVAEFCTEDMNTMQFAWVLIYLAGAYGDAALKSSVMVNLEVNGPGMAVWSEIKMMRQSASLMKEQSHVAQLLMNIQNFLYTRPDSVGGGLAFHTKTTTSEKDRFMNLMKDYHEFGSLIINSAECVREMKNVVRVDGTLGAPGRGKDDRVIAQALSTLAWHDAMRIRLIQAGLTRKQEAERAVKRDSAGKADLTAGRSVVTYLKQLGIKNAEKMAARNR